MPASHCVNKLHVPVQPKSLQLGENVESGELLEVENLDVGHPDLVHQGDVNRDQRVVFVTKLDSDFIRKRKHKKIRKNVDQRGKSRNEYLYIRYDQSWVSPAHQEKSIQGDTTIAM